MEGYFKRVQRLTRSRFWINNVTIAEARQAIEAGAEGCTQNPSYVWKMMCAEGEQERVTMILNKVKKEANTSDEVLVKLQRELVQDVAELFRPMYDSSLGEVGYVSIQGNPFQEDAKTIVATARYNREAGPNIMIKIPVTKEGLEAIATCIAEGMPVNATEVMSIQQAMDLVKVYSHVTKGIKNPPKVFLSHIAGIFDEYLASYVKDHHTEILSDILYQAGKVVAKKIRSFMDDCKTNVGFINGGVRGLHHFTEWVGGDIITTINWKGTADELVKLDLPVVSRFNMPISDFVVDELFSKLPDFAKAYFSRGLNQEEYESFGPVILFSSSFKKAWSQARERVGII